MSVPSGTWTINVDESLLGHNARYADENRKQWQALGLKSVNLVSSPGSGKTALLERTLELLQGRLRCAVVVGDLQTDNDARRLGGKGAPVVQITTGGYCHLEASMISRATGNLDLENQDLLIIENVGNLVCPASFDLGEDRRIVLISVTEGEDKPLKYPTIFHKADIVVITKTDIAEALGADMDALRANIKSAAQGVAVFELSARTGEGMQAWCDYLVTLCRK